MPNAYTWQFPKLDVYTTYETVTNAVYCAHWQLTADDGQGRSATIAGEEELGPIDLDNFVEFDDLTAAIVQGWVEDVMGVMRVDGLKAALDVQIAAMAGPPRAELPPPWV